MPAAKEPGMAALIKAWTAQINDHWDKQGMMPTLRTHLGAAVIEKLAVLAAESCAIDLYAIKVRRELEKMGLPIPETTAIIEEHVMPKPAPLITFPEISADEIRDVRAEIEHAIGQNHVMVLPPYEAKQIEEMSDE